MQITLLYVCKSKTRLVFVTIYVDDLIIKGDHLDEVEKIKGLLKQGFEMKDLGELKFSFWVLKSYAQK